jgi:hypothetical protein
MAKSMLLINTVKNEIQVMIIDPVTTKSAYVLLDVAGAEEIVKIIAAATVNIKNQPRD